MSDTMKEIASWLGFFGVPSICVISGWCAKACIGFSKKLKILMTAQQDQMRGQLLERFHIYNNRGWITDEELKQWESEYQSYHALGENGIIDDRRQQLFRLPVKQI